MNVNELKYKPRVVSFKIQKLKFENPAVERNNNRSIDDSTMFHVNSLPNIVKTPKINKIELNLLKIQPISKQESEAFLKSEKSVPGPSSKVQSSKTMSRLNLRK